MSQLKQEQVDFYVESTRVLEEMAGQHEEMKALFRKMRQSFNGLIGLAVACFIPLVFSFVSLNVTVAKLQESSFPKDEVYRQFVQKIDALAVHMYEDKWVKTQLYKITKDSIYQGDSTTPDLLKAFFQEQSRGEHAKQ